MLQLYIVAGLAALILGLLGLVKVKSAQRAAEAASRQAAEQRAAIAEQAVAQTDKTASAVQRMGEALAEQHRAEQVAVAAGRRDQFDTDGF
ncbi:hypothetical protein [Methylomonas sp. CM2]|uniref:hypothetical protein n=1 Tax=Methylomonas sp. CM2 TaxID=3417647 RepID=UPI003CF46108